ncbi:MAG: NAD kinase [Bacteroidales bacterium]|nr:NAD kinase [Lentimicrobiaceae bacterium]MDD5693687.1 NAD kinase [Bacteroidales bacterium]
MNIGFYGKSIPSESLPAIQQLFRHLTRPDLHLTIYESFHHRLKTEYNLEIQADTFGHHHDIAGNLDYLVSIGGDGTLLDTITLVRDSGIPIFGINTGRLGFLSSVSVEDTDQALDALLNKRYWIDKRTLIRLESPAGLFGEMNYALNEVAVYRKDPNSMLAIHTYVNNLFLNSYWADGLIIATPTGSTAYSLSCGGPIVLPDSQNFIITPIATHNLTVRPVVIPDNSVIRLRVEGRSSEFFVSLDSRFHALDSTSEIILVKEDFKVNLIRMEKHSFFSTIRGKLKWGLDIRN